MSECENDINTRNEILIEPTGMGTRKKSEPQMGSNPICEMQLSSKSNLFGMERLHSNRPIVHTSYDLVHYRPITFAEDFVSSG